MVPRASRVLFVRSSSLAGGLGGDRAARRGGPDAGNLDRARHLTSPGTDCCMHTSPKQRNLCIYRKYVNGATCVSVVNCGLFWQHLSPTTSEQLQQRHVPGLADVLELFCSTFSHHLRTTSTAPCPRIQQLFLNYFAAPSFTPPPGRAGGPALIDGKPRRYRHIPAPLLVASVPHCCFFVVAVFYFCVCFRRYRPRCGTE